MGEIESMVPLVSNALRNAVYLAFQSTGDPRRIERFEYLLTEMGKWQCYHTTMTEIGKWQ
jgi:hypothetical protein